MMGEHLVGVVTAGGGAVVVIGLALLSVLPRTALRLVKFAWPRGSAERQELLSSYPYLTTRYARWEFVLGAYERAVFQAAPRRIRDGGLAALEVGGVMPAELIGAKGVSDYLLDLDVRRRNRFLWASLPDVEQLSEVLTRATIEWWPHLRLVPPDTVGADGRVLRLVVPMRPGTAYAISVAVTGAGKWSVEAVDVRIVPSPACPPPTSDWAARTDEAVRLCLIDGLTKLEGICRDRRDILNGLTRQQAWRPTPEIERSIAAARTSLNEANLAWNMANSHLACLQERTAASLDVT